MNKAPNWPEELDALHAASQHHMLLFENEHVRVLDARVPPGHTVPLHTHQWPSVVYILSFSDFVRRDGSGAVVVDSRTFSTQPSGSALWSGPLPPHTLENVGKAELRVIAIELKKN